MPRPRRRAAGQGLDVLPFTEAAPAREAARRAILDLLVLRERVGGHLAHDLALLAEWRNPGLGVILLSDRGPEAREEIADLIPAIRAILPPDAGAAEVARVTLAVARAQEGGTVPDLSRALALHQAEGIERLAPSPMPAMRRPTQPRQAGPLPVFQRAAQRPLAPAQRPAPAPSSAPPRRLHLA